MVNSDIVILDVPLLHQLDNDYAPRQTCNTTCLAMVARYHGIVGDSSREQLEDQFTQHMADNGYSRYDMKHMAEFLNDEYSARISANLLFDGSVNTIINYVTMGIPVIVSGKFTPSWHFIVIRGYDKLRNVFLVNDPYGEYWRTGYDIGLSNGVEEYSFNLVSALCNDDGKQHTIWCIAAIGEGARDYRTSGKPPATRADWDAALNDS
jgi:uncharacterized protein YvpB